MRWRLRESVRACVLDGAVVLIDDHKFAMFDGPHFRTLVELLEDVSNEGSLSDSARATPHRELLVDALRLLHAEGFVVRAPRPANDRDRLLDSLGVHASSPKLYVARTSTVPDAEFADFASALTAWGCTVVGSDKADTTIVMTSNLLEEELDDHNRAALNAGRSWVLAKTSGPELIAGPRFVPGETGCWRCLAERYAGNHALDLYFRSRLPGGSEPWRRPVVPGAGAHVAMAIVTDALQSGRRPPSPLRGRMSSLDVVTGSQTHHTLVRLPHCPHCGDPSTARRAAVDTPIIMRSAFAVTDVGERLLSHHDVLSKLDPLVGRHLGAFGSVALLPHSGTERHTAVVTHYFPSVSTETSDVRSNLAARSAGHGDTSTSARAGALAEATERLAGVWLPGTPQVRSTYADAPGRILHPRDVLLFSESQYSERKAWNEDPAHLLHRVPEPFDERRPIDFTPAWSLTHGEQVLIPSGLVWYGHPDLRAHRYAITDSNGCAAGGNLTEAALHGLLELVERDAVACWWYSRALRPGVDLDTLCDPEVSRLRRRYRSVGRDLWVLDLTHDLGVPTYAAISGQVKVESQDSAENVVVGFGAHFSPRRALRRAVHEQDQLLPMIEGTVTVGDAAAKQWFDTVRTGRQPWLLPHGSVDPVGEVRHRSPGEQLDGLVATLGEQQIEVVLIDQTRQDLALDVCRVVAPGLRHFWRRTAPGRLFEVPVRLGWVDYALEETDLNPYSVFV